MRDKQITIKKSNGRVYTPDYIVKNILDLSGYHELNILQKHVIDNSCGDGAFLKEIVSRYCDVAISKGEKTEELKNDLETYIHGIEIDRVERDKCVKNLTEIAFKYGVSNVDWDILCADALLIDKYNGRMDFVLGNPPYVRVHNFCDKIEEIKEFDFAQSGMTDLYIVFYEIGLKMLNCNGVLGYITPSSFFNSVAGNYLRNEIINRNLLYRIVNLKHFQAFSATTYTTITILRNKKKSKETEYYQFDEKNLIPYYVESLLPNEFYILNSFYFAKKEDLAFLKRVLNNLGHSDIMVKNGYATLCDNVFINDFNFESKHIIPVVKASTGAMKKIVYPYNKNAKLITEFELKQDEEMYSYLIAHKNDLQKRSNENEGEQYWYAFGRSQALNDTYKDKLTINTLLRTRKDWKMIFAPVGTGVYSGLYITSETIDIESIKDALNCDEFILYIKLLGKYKSGGYYTFSSKDVKAFLDYKLAYNGGVFA